MSMPYVSLLAVFMFEDICSIGNKYLTLRFSFLLCFPPEDIMETGGDDPVATEQWRVHIANFHIQLE